MSRLATHLNTAILLYHRDQFEVGDWFDVWKYSSFGRVRIRN
jgi:hypothetical protein